MPWRASDLGPRAVTGLLRHFSVPTESVLARRAVLADDGHRHGRSEKPCDRGAHRPHRNRPRFDPLAYLDDLLSDVGLSRPEAGASVSFAGQDPIVPAAHRLGACIGVPLMAGAVAAVALHRHRGGPAQDLHLDLRQAVHTINPGAFWHPTLNGEPAPHPLVLDNPFLVTPYRTADGRWVMASAVYPHLVAKWCRFLMCRRIPPGSPRRSAPGTPSSSRRRASARGPADLRRAHARRSGWPTNRARCWPAQPVIGLERIGDAPARDYGAAARPFDGIRVLSFTHAVAGPTVGRTLAEHGADVLCATRPNDYEHEFIYAEANVGSRSAYVDLDESDRQGTGRDAPRRGRRRGQQPSTGFARAPRARSAAAGGAAPRASCTSRSTATARAARGPGAGDST